MRNISKVVEIFSGRKEILKKSLNGMYLPLHGMFPGIFLGDISIISEEYFSLANKDTSFNVFSNFYYKKEDSKRGEFNLEETKDHLENKFKLKKSSYGESLKGDFRIFAGKNVERYYFTLSKQSLPEYLGRNVMGIGQPQFSDPSPHAEIKIIFSLPRNKNTDYKEMTPKQLRIKRRKSSGVI
jgi:hypothetical protein